MMKTVRVIDSHTAGEPTRVVLEGGPELGAGTLAERAARFAADHTAFQRQLLLEPRGSDVWVGALLVSPDDPAAIAGVIYFDNVQTLGMCGHGTLGVLATLAHLGRIAPGPHALQTPVGTIQVEWLGEGRGRLMNVPSYRRAAQVPLRLDQGRDCVADIAWGGNWFAIVACEDIEIDRREVERLAARARSVRRAANAAGYPEVDHVMLVEPHWSIDRPAPNFVLCPGLAYDRSPCGTGTSARLACLAADGRIEPHRTMEQPGIVGQSFHASYLWLDASRSAIVPTLTGHAFITAEATLLFDPRDPLRHGIQ